jgi:hypothetical protein
VGLFLSLAVLKRQFHFFELLLCFFRGFEAKSFRGLVSLWEMQSIHGLTPEFGGDAETGASACVLAIG